MYHFIGIKCAGMSALAVILKQLGYDVCGSDVSNHYFTEAELIKNNIPIYPYNADNIKPNQIIIKGLSITEDNIELKKARELNLEIINYNEMVGRLTKEFKTICICGCHGKTTTTAMTAHILGNIKGINYLIGDGTGYANKNNDLFALESCEYKRHFLSYSPYYTVILNIDLDHVDYFKDISDVINAYQEFANLSSKMIIANGDDINIKNMKVEKDIKYFGINPDNNIRATNISYNKDGISFDVLVDNEEYGHFDLPIYGIHQLMDALAVISVCYYEDISSSDVNKYFSTFHGAKRRFTETVVNQNIIIDDYAHHPNEIKSTINAIKQKYPDKIIVSIFQPHTFSRTKEFATDIATELGKTNVAYIMDIHPAREKQEDYPDITNNTIISQMKNAHSLKISEAKILNRHKDAVFIFMSPNDISKLENELLTLKKLEQNN